MSTRNGPRSVSLRCQGASIQPSSSRRWTSWISMASIHLFGETQTGLVWTHLCFCMAAAVDGPMVVLPRIARSPQDSTLRGAPFLEADARRRHERDQTPFAVPFADDRAGMDQQVALVGGERKRMAFVEDVAVQHGPAGEGLAGIVDHVADLELRDVLFAERKLQVVDCHRYLPSNQFGLSSCSTVPSAPTRVVARRATRQLLLVASAMPAIWV